MRLDSPVLQVALDVIHLKRALEIAGEAVKGGADWVEAGTPLIKSEGMDAIRELKKRFQGRVIVADMKAMDVGGVEVEMAARAGASVVTVMGAADDPTIKEAVLSGEKYGAEVMVDLLGVEDKARRAKEVEELGAHYLCVHVSIDAQMKGKNPFKELEEVRGATSIPVAVAGGITAETAGEAVREGAEIVIVGGFIIKSPDASEAARAVKEAMKGVKVESGIFYHRYRGEEIRKAFRLVSAPNVADAQHREGAMVGIRPVRPGLKFAGPAFTVKTIDGDWAKPVEAIEKAHPGDVIVIDAGGGHTAIWGELATWSARMKGIAGVVVDGAVRDVDDISAMGFPIFTRNISPHAGEPKGYGEIGVEVVCGGVKVRPGDWVVGDDSGVVVVPKERAEEIANRAMDVRERENRYREEIKRGRTLSEVLELEEWEKVT